MLSTQSLSASHIAQEPTWRFTAHSFLCPACNRFWCKKLVPKNKIDSELHQGWQGSRSNQSIKALKWLACQEHQLRLQHPTNGDCIRTVSNRGEVRLFGRYPLRLCHSTTYRIRVPGVPCFPIHHNRHPICHHYHTMHKVYEATLKKQEILRQRGCAVKVMWECGWDHEVKPTQSYASSSAC